MMKILLIQVCLLVFSYSLKSQSIGPEQKYQTPDHEISNCPDLVTLSGPVVKDLYQAKDIHLTDVVVFPIIELSLISETQVDLNSEIEVPTGSSLTIDISDCPSDSGQPDPYISTKDNTAKRTNP